MISFGETEFPCDAPSLRTVIGKAMKNELKSTNLRKKFYTFLPDLNNAIAYMRSLATQKAHLVMVVSILYFECQIKEL